MTVKAAQSTLSTALIADQPESVATSLLLPLLEGRPVCLSVTDKRLPKKTRDYQTVLVLTPSELLGLDSGYLLASMPPYGSEFIRIGEDFKAITFARLGLRGTMGSALASALLELYFGGKHGNRTSK